MDTHILLDISDMLIFKSMETPYYLQKLELDQVGNEFCDKMLSRLCALRIAQFLLELKGGKLYRWGVFIFSYFERVLEIGGEIMTFIYLFLIMTFKTG